MCTETKNNYNDKSRNDGVVYDVVESNIIRGNNLNNDRYKEETSDNDEDSVDNLSQK